MRFIYGSFGIFMVVMVFMVVRPVDPLLRLHMSTIQTFIALAGNTERDIIIEVGNIIHSLLYCCLLYIQ